MFLLPLMRISYCYNKTTLMDGNSKINLFILSLGTASILCWQLLNILEIYRIEYDTTMSEVNNALINSVYELNSQLPQEDDNMIALDAGAHKIAIIVDGEMTVIELSDKHLLLSENRALYDIKNINNWSLDSLYVIFSNKIETRGIHTPVYFQLVDSNENQIKSFQYGQFPFYGVMLADTIELGFLKKHKLISYYAFPLYNFWIKSKDSLILSFSLLFVLFACLLMLTRAIQEAKKCRKFQELCVHTLAHNLKFPLNNLVKTVRILEKEFKGIVIPERLELIQNVRNQVEMAFLDIRRLLFLSIQSPKMKIKLEKIDLKALLEDIDISSFNVHTKNKDVELKIRSCRNNWIWGNSNYLLIVFQNLIDNAIKYSSPEQVLIEITCQELKDKISVSIRDNGYGINMKDQKNIFKKYFRAKESLGEKVPNGYGLGLFFVRSVVKAHHGKIFVYSVKNQGTEFTITLPKVKVYETQN